MMTEIDEQEGNDKGDVSKPNQVMTFVFQVCLVQYKSSSSDVQNCQLPSFVVRLMILVGVQRHDECNGGDFFFLLVLMLWH